MKPLTHRRQEGATLLVGMIMLVVLTLLVVLAIRSGNTNLRIAGNMQAQTEVGAATQQAIEQVIEQIKVPTTDISTIKAQTITVPVGSTSYTVTVAAMSGKCKFETPVLNSSLNPALANDRACFQSSDPNRAILADGSLSSSPSVCKTQQWEIQAGVSDSSTGSAVTEVQGLAVRVPTTTPCL